MMFLKLAPCIPIFIIMYSLPVSAYIGRVSWDHEMSIALEYTTMSYW